MHNIDVGILEFLNRDSKCSSKPNIKWISREERIAKPQVGCSKCPDKKARKAWNHTRLLIFKIKPNFVYKIRKAI